MRWWHRFRGHRIRGYSAAFVYGSIPFEDKCSCGKRWTL